jgi:hypothetical protein
MIHSRLVKEYFFNTIYKWQKNVVYSILLYVVMIYATNKQHEIRIRIERNENVWKLKIPSVGWNWILGRFCIVC